MTAREPLVVEHIEYRAREVAEHDDFVRAIRDAASKFRLPSRGCRSMDVTRGEGSEAVRYRVRFEWRSRVELDAYLGSDASTMFDRAMAPFERVSGVVETRVVEVDAGPESVAIDASALRRAFGHFPTGITIVTAMGPDGPAGMVVSSFTSVSLNPPLVSFCASHTSTTWPIVADARVCCINVLSAAQEKVCQTIASKAGPRFEAVEWSPAPSGAPILTGAVGWLDCEIVDVRLAGDHDLVVLRVVAHEAGGADLEPLVFHRSAYRTLVQR